jgi:hypothetical protein
MYTDPSGQSTNLSKSSGSSDPYYRFDKVLDYMYEQMITNSQGTWANQMRSLSESNYSTCPSPFFDPNVYIAGYVGNEISKYIQFFLLVKGGGEWDHKPKIKSMLNLQNQADLYFPMRGNDEFEIYYDIWSNIHYGYVGSSIGISTETLQFFPNMELYVPTILKAITRKVFGQSDAGDAISIDIGISLWQKYKFGLSKEELHNEILTNIPAYFNSQDLNGNQRIDNNEVDPVIGKLMPRSYALSDWK